jgi:ribulose bisphosphate carboxylase small subunit
MLESWVERSCRGKYLSSTKCLGPTGRVSRAASLIAIGYAALSYNHFSEGRTSKFKGWTIWDPLNGQTRGTVAAKIQAFRFISEQKHPRQAPYAAALSAKGGLFAVAGNQTLEVFSVPPERE